MQEISAHDKKGLNILKTVAVVSLIISFIKLGAYFYTSSMLVLTSAMDSLSDCLTSAVNLYVFKKAREKPDKEHPFGHGGFEVFGSLIQGMLIAFFGVSLLMECIRRFFSGSVAMENGPLGVAVIVMLLSAVVGFVISWSMQRSIKAFEKENARSIALLSDKLHYSGDALVNFMGAVGLVLVYYTGNEKLDVFFSVVASLILLGTSLPILKKCYGDIVHQEADPDVQKKMVEVILKTDTAILGVHALRSRRLGPHLFVDFHLKLNSTMLLYEAHKISDAVEKSLNDTFQYIDIKIHMDPDSEDDQVDWDPTYK